VSVSTQEKLTTVVEAHSEGTTFWLAPGTHHLGNGRYNQVQPHAGDTFIGAPGAILDGRQENSYAFGGHASHVTIRFLTVQNFGAAGDNNNEGVVNHDSAEGWTVDSSTVQRNAGAGVMIGSGGHVLGNCLRDNGQYGFNAYHADGVKDIVLDGNEITGNNTDNWERRQPGCGCTGGGKFWSTSGATVTGNYVHDNKGVGLWADNNNAGFLFKGNYVSGNDAEGIMYETSYNAAILDNTFVRNALVKGPTNPKFPAAAVYLSESGSDPRVAGPYGNEFRVSGNQFIDNWSGVVAWENADRFAGSPANTSTGEGTLVNRSVATVEACSDKANIKSKPYFDDCRWKTQNIVVDGNVFRTDPSKIHLCVSAMGCGFNGLFSNYGTYPRWSPYKAKVVEENITFRQNNVWRNNTYVGDWQFMVEESGHMVSWDVWRAAPYHQDSGSTAD
jgi:parallel beta-helix repeat protein